MMFVWKLSLQTLHLMTPTFRDVCLRKKRGEEDKHNVSATALERKARRAKQRAG